MPMNVCSSVRFVGVIIPSPPQAFHLVVSHCVVRAGHLGRRRRTELTRRTDHEWNALAPVRAERERNQTDRILPPVSGLVARKIIDANCRLGNLRPIIETHRENGCSCPLPNRSRLLFAVRSSQPRNLLQGRHQTLVFAMATTQPAYRARPG